MIGSKLLPPTFALESNATGTLMAVLADKTAQVQTKWSLHTGLSGGHYLWTMNLR